MVNASGISNQSTPDRAEPKPAECPPDNKLPENSQENLDARLDHAIEETFPTSDPVSVTITKGPEPDRPDRTPVPHRRMTSRADRNRPQLSMFSIRCGRRSTMSPGVPLRSPGMYTAAASATRVKLANSTLKLSIMLVTLEACHPSHDWEPAALALRRWSHRLCAGLDDPWRETKPRPTRAGSCQNQTRLCFAG